MLAASGFSLVSLWFQAEKGTLAPLECLSFANNIQADLPTYARGLSLFYVDSLGGRGGQKSAYFTK